METQILINPDNENYTEEEILKALDELSAKHEVKVSEIPNTRCDKGFGQEATFLIIGNTNDIYYFMEELEDWATC